ncbi:hypothetical protein HN873_024223, partial [Arachis hypogaea]
ILSGKKNKGNNWENESADLIGYAWDLWTKERPLEIVDDILIESCNLSQVLRCIQISLLCLEQHPYDRLDMSSELPCLSQNNLLYLLENMHINMILPTN